jgi:hypothetical protein
MWSKNGICARGGNYNRASREPEPGWLWCRNAHPRLRLKGGCHVQTLKRNQRRKSRVWLIWQLFQAATDEKNLDCVRTLMLRGQPLVSKLWNTFKSISKLVVALVYCIIEGLDECSDPVQVILRHVLELLLIQVNFKTITLGRSHTLQKEFSAINSSKSMCNNLFLN